MYVETARHSSPFEELESYTTSFAICRILSQETATDVDELCTKQWYPCIDIRSGNTITYMIHYNTICFDHDLQNIGNAMKEIKSYFEYIIMHEQFCLINIIVFCTSTIIN
jgi:hypothetical protein